MEKAPRSRNSIDHAINSSLEESLGSLAQATPALVNRLIKIALDKKIRRYTSLLAIQTAIEILQIGIIDRENKSEIKKIRRALEQLEGEPSEIVDI